MLSTFNILSEENASVPQLKQNQDKKQRKALGNLSVNRVPSHRGVSTPLGKPTMGSSSASVMKPQTAVKFKIVETLDPKEMVCSGAGSVIKEDLFTTEFKHRNGKGRNSSVLNELRDTSNIIVHDSKRNTKSLDASIEISDDLSALANNIFDNI